MQGLETLRNAPPEKVALHLQVWRTFSSAVAQARRITPDRAGQGDGGSYKQAAEALEWLLSADAYAWLQKVNCGPVLAPTLQRIGYADLFNRITAAARQSLAGRMWMDTPAYANLERLKREVDAHFNSSPLIAVA